MTTCRGVFPNYFAPCCHSSLNGSVSSPGNPFASHRRIASAQSYAPEQDQPETDRYEEAPPTLQNHCDLRKLASLLSATKNRVTHNTTPRELSKGKSHERKNVRTAGMDWNFTQRQSARQSSF